MTLPPWLQGLPDPERMRATDRWAIEEQGIPGLELMERAGRGLADLVLSVAPDGPIAVVCGKGNNGGDGYVAARLLRDAGRAVRALAVAAVSELSGDARANAERVDGVEPFDAARLADCAVAVDALLGTGFSGTPHGAVADAIDALNDAGLPIVAADVPSGVDAATGVVEGKAIRARATATFAAAKPGLWINPGKSHAGTVRVIDIGIPEGAPIDEPDVALIADAELLALLPSREAGWTKFTSGHVLVAGGSRGLTGAPSLASEAAQRAGAGYVTACVPASAQPILAQRLLEAMTRGAARGRRRAHRRRGRRGARAGRARRGARRRARASGAATEPSPSPASSSRAPRWPWCSTPTASTPTPATSAPWPAARAPTILTPHEGELGRLLDVDSSAVAARRLEHARAAAAQAQAIVVLKGDDTLVADPDGLVAVSPGATGALATAGTGDVLSGVLAAVLSRGVEPFMAACAGVRLHARAGIHAAHEKGVDGVIARDVIEALPFAR